MFSLKVFSPTVLIWSPDKSSEWSFGSKSKAPSGTEGILFPLRYKTDRLEKLANILVESSSIWQSLKDIVVSSLRRPNSSTNLSSSTGKKLFPSSIKVRSCGLYPNVVPLMCPWTLKSKPLSASERLLNDVDWKALSSICSWGTNVSICRLMFNASKFGNF